MPTKDQEALRRIDRGDDSVGARLRRMMDFGASPSVVLLVRGAAVDKRFDGKDVRDLTMGRFMDSHSKAVNEYVEGDVAILFMEPYR